jgi:predicted MFS family arabinose efflux permease
VRAGPLAEREFRLLFAGQAASALGDRITPVALAFAVLDLTGSTTDLGLVLAAATLPMLAFLLVGGVWADRLPRQRLMLTSDVIRALAQGTTAALLISGEARLWQLLVLQAVNGCAAGFFRPAATGLIPETVPPALLQQANALVGLTRDVGSIVGPAVAGVLITVLSPGWGLAVDAATFVVSAAFLAGLRVAPRLPRAGNTFVRELREGWNAFRSRTWLWATVAYFAFLIGFVLAPFQVLGPVVARNELGGAGAWAIIATATGVGAVSGGVVALRWRPRRPLLISFVLFVVFWAPQLILLAIPAPTAAIAVGGFCAGAVMTFASAVWDTVLQSNVPPESLSRVSSYDWLGSLALQPLGFALVGPVVATIGIEATLYAGVAWMLLTSLLLIAVPDVRRLGDRTAVAA